MTKRVRWYEVLGLVSECYSRGGKEYCVGDVGVE